MKQERIEYVRVWSPWLRASHWVIAFGALFEIASAFGMRNDVSDPGFWRDWHVIVGQLVALALAVRVALLFTPGSSNWREFLPRRSQFPAMLQMIRFYISFTRHPLPAWFAHNPLWKPVYPLALLLLAVSAASGLAFHTDVPLAGYSAAGLHATVASPIGVFALFHVIAVFLHDLKGRGAFVSAMIGGYRYVHVGRNGPGARTRGPVSASLDGITTPDSSRKPRK